MTKHISKLSMLVMLCMREILSAQNISRVTIREIYSLQSFEKLLCHEIKLALNFINASFQKLYLCKK